MSSKFERKKKKSAGRICFERVLVTGGVLNVSTALERWWRDNLEGNFSNVLTGELMSEGKIFMWSNYRRKQRRRKIKIKDAVA